MLSNFINLLLTTDNSGRPQWITDSFPIIQGVLVAIITLVSIIMIIAILASPPNSANGTNSITGVTESYYSKNKSKNNLGRIRNLIIVCASLIAIMTIAYFVLFGIFNMSGA